MNASLVKSSSMEIQAFDAMRDVALALGENARAASVGTLNRMLADTLSLRDLYKKHHWQASGPTFHQLHLLFDRHHAQQAEIADTLAERIMALGGVSVALSHDVAEATRIPRAPKGREGASDQLRRLVAAHELILGDARVAARDAAEAGDDGTNDLIVSQVIRTGEAQVWFLSEHLQTA